MKEEIDKACEFICSNLRSNSYTTVTDDQIKTYRNAMRELLTDKFTGHWYPEKPMRGNGYRCINVDRDTKSIDPVLEKAAEVSNISNDLILSTFSSGLAVWIDPGDVSYRAGRSSVISSLYKDAVKPSEQVKVTHDNYWNLAQTVEQSILTRHPDLTAKKFKQLLRQYEKYDRLYWANTNMHKRTTVVY